MIIDGIKISAKDKILVKPNPDRKWWQFWKKRTAIYIAGGQS